MNAPRGDTRSPGVWRKPPTLPVTQADMEQASGLNVLLSVEWAVLTLRGEVSGWVVVRRDGHPLTRPYPTYTDYDRWLTEAYWVCGIAPRGTPWANALYRREVLVTLTPQGRFIGIPRALGTSEEASAHCC